MIYRIEYQHRDANLKIWYTFAEVESLDEARFERRRAERLPYVAAVRALKQIWEPVDLEQER